MTGLRLRPEVQRFAEGMERRLLQNDHKGGWRMCTGDLLMKRLFEASVNLEDADPDDVAGAAADVANYAMMVADNFGGLMGKGAHEK